MIEYLKLYQLDIMLALIGICFAFAVLVLLSRALPKKRRLIILAIELTGMFLLGFDRLTYIYDGDVSDKGYIMVRLSNAMIFALMPFCAFVFAHYIMNLLEEDRQITIPKRLWAAMGISVIGVVTVIAAHFTDIFYYFDKSNYYHRGSLFALSFVIPVISVILMAWVVIQYRKHFSRIIFFSILLFLFGPFAAAVVQIFFASGLSLLNNALVITSILIYIFAYLDINEKVNRANAIKIEYLEEQRKLSERMFEQTATALANSIDAKDEYTRGHSLRVAEYSVKIARHIGKSEEECKKVFYTALLHDVGKIGIADNIITKKGRLSDEEYEAMKQHPVIGSQILSGIRDYPYLGIGAHYHHERYDGKGYPDGLKGEEIPEVARIISVADAYDTMTSNRSYRAAIPQQIAREEIVKNAGTQFDPVFARVMQYLIDIDNNYTMKERKAVTQVIDDGTLSCDMFGSEVSDGILLSTHAVKVQFRYEPDKGQSGSSYPSIILFDSLDSHYHGDEKSARELFYAEYAVIRADGEVKNGEARKTNVRKSKLKMDGTADPQIFEIEAVRVRDHASIKIKNRDNLIDVLVAFPDCTRFSYIGLTGEHCTIDSVKINHADEETAGSDIPRIAEEISYIRENAGDIPNVQVDTFRSDATKGIEVTDGLKMTFHSVSLPTARLIWHCPYIVLYWSENGEVKGSNAREYGLVRLDGEYWDGVGVK
ncbi:MAG: HD domain-containing protein, partial [Lachnospiraceae bacterium]|nr:HD domain-containing protein [Lachnospiraceae bacterium]